MWARGAAMGPPCDLSWGKHRIGIADDTSPDVLWTGWSDPVHLWEGETESGQRREHPISVHPRLCSLLSEGPWDPGSALNFYIRICRIKSFKI